VATIIAEDHLHSIDTNTLIMFTYVGLSEMSKLIVQICPTYMYVWLRNTLMDSFNATTSGLGAKQGKLKISQDQYIIL
jgi:hypothetical protein